MRDQSGECANCGRRIWRTPSGQWHHCYIGTGVYCSTGVRSKKAMLKEGTLKSSRTYFR